MEVLGIIGLLLAVVVMIYGAFKGLGAIPLTLLASLVVILCNAMPIWASYSGYYMGGFTGTLSGYLLMLMASCLYAKFMDVSGCAKSLAMWIVDKMGKKNVLLALTLITIILTWGGVSLFVALFVVGPIGIAMLKEVNYPRHLILAAFAIGGGMLSVTSLPGTTQLTNVIPTQYLGTTLTAAPVLSIIISAAQLAIGIWYLKLVERRALDKGESWSDEGLDLSRFATMGETNLPPVGRSVIPIIFMLAAIIGLSFVVSDTTMLTTYCMLAATVICLLLNLNRFKGKDMKKLLTAGLGDGVTAITALAAVVGFGTVVQYSASFANVSGWVMGLDLSPYWKGVVSTAVISGVTGSGSGGLKLVFENFGQYFIESGCNLDILHRLCALASGTLDSLPHNSGLFLTFAYLGLTHKQGYKHYWWMTVVAPAVVVVVATLVVTLMGL